MTSGRPQHVNPTCNNCADKKCGCASDIPCGEWKYEGEEITKYREEQKKKQIDKINSLIRKHVNHGMESNVPDMFDTYPGEYNPVFTSDTYREKPGKKEMPKHCGHECVCRHYVDNGPCIEPDADILPFVNPCPHDTRARGPVAEQHEQCQHWICIDHSDGDEWCCNRPPVAQQALEFRCPAAEFTSEEGIMICHLGKEWKCPKQIHVPDNEEPLCESQPLTQQAPVEILNAIEQLRNQANALSTIITLEPNTAKELTHIEGELWEIASKLDLFQAPDCSQCGYKRFAANWENAKTHDASIRKPYQDTIENLVAYLQKHIEEENQIIRISNECGNIEKGNLAGHKWSCYYGTLQQIPESLRSEEMKE